MSKNQCLDEPHRSLQFACRMPKFNDYCLKRFLSKRSRLPEASAVAKKAANRVIYKLLEQQWSIQMYCCQRCRQLPTNPVTGPCGHTWCIQCTQNGRCHCGVLAPASLHVDSLIRSLIEMLIRKWDDLISVAPDSYHRRRNVRISRQNLLTQTKSSRLGDDTSKLESEATCEPSPTSRLSGGVIPLDPQDRFEYVVKLLQAENYSEAAPVLAAIAVGGSQAKAAKSLLAKIITLKSKGKDKNIPKVTLSMHRSAVFPYVKTWFTPSDLECVLCFNTYTSPVTTQCGHTYCRGCILKHSKQCPLCRHPLSKLELTIINENCFINSALAAVGEIRQTYTSIIPVLFLPTVAFPMIPCPIYIFDPMFSRYLPMIKKVLEYGTRRFGVSTLHPDGSTADFGTIVEVCDCILFQDGSCILSTIGVSRFKILELSDAEGCVIVKIQSVIDTKLNKEQDWLNCYYRSVVVTAKNWLSYVDADKINAIYYTYGKPPLEECKTLPTEWNPDGPKLFWWFFSILPLGRDLRVLILSSRSMAHRAVAMMQILDALINK